jgi:hypothetical protein
LSFHWIDIDLLLVRVLMIEETGIGGGNDAADILHHP